MILELYHVKIIKYNDMDNLEGYENIKPFILHFKYL